VRPYQLVKDSDGNFKEVISYPYKEGDQDEVLVRVPGDPTTLKKDDPKTLTLLVATCPREGHVWVPMLKGEYNNAHIDCTTCGRGYYIVYDDGKVVNFNADRLLELSPLTDHPNYHPLTF
jgi:hypothetical protein